MYFKIKIVPGLCKHYWWDWVLLYGFDFILWTLSRIYIKIMKMMKIVCECTQRLDISSLWNAPKMSLIQG